MEKEIEAQRLIFRSYTTSIHSDFQQIIRKEKSHSEKVFQTAFSAIKESSSIVLLKHNVHMNHLGTLVKMKILNQ